MLLKKLPFKIELDLTVYYLVWFVFVALKLTHVIDWPWLWIMSPLWGAMVLYLAAVLLFLLAYAFACIIMWICERFDDEEEMEEW